MYFVLDGFEVPYNHTWVYLKPVPDLVTTSITSLVPMMTFVGMSWSYWGGFFFIFLIYNSLAMSDLGQSADWIPPFNLFFFHNILHWLCTVCLLVKRYTCSTKVALATWHSGYYAKSVGIFQHGKQKQPRGHLSCLQFQHIKWWNYLFSVQAI